MFGIGIPELIVIMVIALIVIGPEKLPDIAKTLGKALSEFKNVVDGVKTSMEDEQRSIEKNLNDKPEKAYTMSLGDKEEELKKDYEEALADEDGETAAVKKPTKKSSSNISGKSTKKEKPVTSSEEAKPKKTRKRKVKDEVVKEA